jgi:hypothetical protein
MALVSMQKIKNILIFFNRWGSFYLSEKPLKIQKIFINFEILGEIQGWKKPSFLKNRPTRGFLGG